MSRRRYQPLLEVLAAFPEEQTSLTFTVVELEELLRHPLPASAARTNRFWYGGSVAESNWLARGFTAHLDRRTKTITFQR